MLIKECWTNNFEQHRTYLIQIQFRGNIKQLSESNNFHHRDDVQNTPCE